jgi:SagB-type dehydrogenase family enzyme
MSSNELVVHLPPPSQKGGMSLAEAINQRRSIRRFAPYPISRAELSQILWAAQGIRDALWGYRTVPSAGATYPLEVFVVCGSNCIEKMDSGIYHYKPDTHSLSLHCQEDVRIELARASLDQEFVYEAPVDIVICAVYERTLASYGARGRRYVHMEVGHAGQNIYLQATALGLATVAIGAFHDEEVRSILRLEEQYKPLYIMPVGKPA